MKIVEMEEMADNKVDSHLINVVERCMRQLLKLRAGFEMECTA